MFRSSYALAATLVACIRTRSIGWGARTFVRTAHAHHSSVMHIRKILRAEKEGETKAHQQTLNTGFAPDSNCTAVLHSTKCTHWSPYRGGRGGFIELCLGSDFSQPNLSACQKPLCDGPAAPGVHIVDEHSGGRRWGRWCWRLDRHGLLRLTRS